MSRSPDAIYARRRHQSAKVAYSHEPRRVELREQLRRPLAEIAKNKVVGDVVDEDPDRWSQSSAGREYKMKGNSLRAPAGEVGRLSARPRPPRQPPGIVEGLGLAVG